MKVRLSYTLLNLWMQGKVDEAVNCYFRLKTDTVFKGYEDGKRIHEEIATHITTHTRFPPFLPHLPLKSPVVEEKHVVTFSDQFDLSGVFDARDADTLYEFKTGVSDSVEWANTLQIPFYFLIAKIANIPLEKAYLIHYNQHDNTHDFCIIHNGPQQVNKAINLVESIGPEILDFFDKEGLI